jgi:glutamine amidotransferase
MKVAVIDYGLGNIGSVSRSLELLNTDVFIATTPQSLNSASAVILPGVGSFAEGMRNLISEGWPEAIHKYVVSDGRPMLGICLGMQLLASSGDEGGAVVDGLGLIPGNVMRLDALGCREHVPHVGWNDTYPENISPLFSGVVAGTDFYYVHSYTLTVESKSQIIGVAKHGIQFVAAVQSDNIYGTQFHPEKSGHAGIQVLRNFLATSQC